MRWVLGIAAAVHALFMVFELFPPSVPFLLSKVSEKLPNLKDCDKPFTDVQLAAVSNIVRNAGIYNGIVAGGLCWAAWYWPTAGAVSVARVMLLGASVAGIFGAITLKSSKPAAQALVGIGGLILSLTVLHP